MGTICVEAPKDEVCRGVLGAGGADLRGTRQVKTIKPVPGWLIPPEEEGRVHFPPAKGHPKDRDDSSSQEVSQQSGTVNGGSRATVQTQGHADPESSGAAGDSRATVTRGHE